MPGISSSILSDLPELRLKRACYRCAGLTQPGGMSYYNFIRKPASDFGWDWCALLMPRSGHVHCTKACLSLLLCTSAILLEMCSGSVLERRRGLEVLLQT